jgi:transcriptional regulator with XRE-family HTH domain
MVRHAPTDASAEDHRLLGRALRELRDQAGVTQEELGAMADIGASYLSQLENGHRGVGWHTVTRLLQALDTDLQKLGDAIDKQKRSPTR